MAAPALKRHVGDLWPQLGLLFEAGDQVARIRGEIGWGHVLALIDAEVAAVQRQLDEGAYRYSHPELAWAHGRLSGLKALREAADAIVEHAAKRQQEQAESHERAAAQAAQEA
jgi:hypothetical protein